MMLGKIFGRVTTKEFKFLVQNETKKFEYVQIYHGVYDYVLAQVIELEKNENMTTATCQIIGYVDKKDGKVKSLRIPLEPNSEVFLAELNLIQKVICLEDDTTGAYLGKLDGKDLNVHLDLKKLLTKHLAVLAKSGSGKSYSVGVLLEEIIDKNVPLLIIDPHGEYSSLKYPNEEESEIKQMINFNISPKGYQIQEYSDTKINIRAKPLKLPENLSNEEIIKIIPQKLSNNQLGLLYNAINNSTSRDFAELILNLQAEESSNKWQVIAALEQLIKLDLFSASPTPYHEMIRSGIASIINLRGINPEVQEIIVYKLTKDLFELRKQNKIPPFFLVLEEAHNFCPERSFGEKTCSKIIRTVASEGRKFGLGLCVISQRPARVDKSVISQCTTQIILKLTNPNDLKAVSNSVEGITNNTEKEIQNLSIGTALVTGITDVPLFVNVRPRRSQHGGHTISILPSSEQHSLQNNISQNTDDGCDMFQELESFQKQKLLPIIKPDVSEKDLNLMSENPIKKINKILIPSYILTCKDKDLTYKLLVTQTNGEIITNIEEYQTKKIPDLQALTKKELTILQFAFSNKEFSSTDLIQKLGTNIDVEEELNNLTTKEYLVKDNNYNLNNKFIFSSLKNYKTFKDSEFIRISYDFKEEPKISLDKIIEVIQKFTTVIDNVEVFVLKYQVEY